MKIEKTAEKTYHIYENPKDDAMLYRYGILARDGVCPDDGACTEENGVLTFRAGKRDVTVETESRAAGGFRLRIPLTERERLFGLGDATRECVMVRGMRTEMFIENVTSYGPMPVLYSDAGWALVLNCTFRNSFDCAKTDPSAVVIEASGGAPDFYLFRGKGLQELVGLVTAVTGRPMLLPKFAYGLTFVQNEETDARSMLWDIRTLRDRDIPCDTMGLEPAWMEQYYDFSTEKEWNKKLFPLPSWYPKNSADNFSFFFPMREMGMQLSLWLCSEYDLFYEEDRQLKKEQALAAERAEGKEPSPDSVIIDEHFAPGHSMDRITHKGEPWFEHLKKFVDNGAAAFKLDGSNQVIPHPDRLWGGKYLDEEAHNIYPVILEKQITKGFADYTGRRLLLYSAGAYTGTQQFAATWAGDTGGGPKTLVSLMNYAMCGHSNTACDIDVTDPESIHYGFLTPWSQYFCWANWKYPWFLKKEREDLIRFYAQLRSSLVPYLYTMAHKAYETGLPLLRPLPLMYEDTDRFDGVKNEYMLGDELLVGVFDMHLTLPEGRWVDYFTEQVYSGDLTYEIPAGRGGALFVREGSILVTMQPQKYVLEKPHDYIVSVYPGADCEYTLYEDDGFTYDYREGKCARTRFVLSDSSEDGYTLTVYPRTGDFPGRPDNGHDILHNSIPEILPMQRVRDMTVSLHGKKPSAVLCGGKEVPFVCDGKTASFVLPAEAHENGVLTYRVRY